MATWSHGFAEDIKAHSLRAGGAAGSGPGASFRNAVGALSLANLDAAVTFVGPMPRIDDALREYSLDIVADQLAITGAEQGLSSPACPRIMCVARSKDCFSALEWCARAIGRTTLQF